MYQLILTHDERKAFDWVGDRYNADTVACLLRMNCSFTPDVDWDSDEDITYNIPKWVSWQIKELADEEDRLWPCFSDSLRRKLNGFLDSIV